MARHAQPREVAELKGATRKNPQRYRKTPPACEQPLGTAPDHMGEHAKACWFEIETYAPSGVLRGADRLLLEIASELLAEFRADPEAFPAARLGHLVGCLARLGMSPADRQKLGVEKAKEENPFAAF